MMECEGFREVEDKMVVRGGGGGGGGGGGERGGGGGRENVKGTGNARNETTGLTGLGRGWVSVSKKSG